ncbi:MAG: formylmethanofuran dehydrogenase subunit E family protein [Armatimonadota bacterium]
MRKFTNIELAKSYHGHLGPNLVIGIKIGNYAINALNAKSHFGIEAEVHCPEKPPVSCMIDGVQLSTGCTMGKANIKHIISSENPMVVCRNKETGEEIKIQVNDGFIEKCLAWYKELGEESASMKVWEMDDEEVFTVCGS